MATNWLKQTKERPLFSDLLWSRPQTKARAGKLLIIGGNLHGFSVVAEAFAAASQAGTGTSRVILPDKLKSTVEKLFPEAEFAPSNVSGSFAKNALAEWLDAAAWADGVLVAGDIGRNSETGMAVEAFLGKFDGPLVLSGDSLELFWTDASVCLDRASTTLVLDFKNLQKLASNAKFTKPFTSFMNLDNLATSLDELSRQHQACMEVYVNKNVLVACHGKVSVTKADLPPAKLAAAAAVWWLQNPDKPFEAVTTSIVA